MEYRKVAEGLWVAPRERLPKGTTVGHNTFTCPCGATMARGTARRHMKTARHKQACAEKFGGDETSWPCYIPPGERVPNFYPPEAYLPRKVSGVPEQPE
jgi:hypothetical protein